VFRSANVVVLPRIGHVAMMERPDLVARLMRGFFALAETGGSPRPATAASGSGELNQVPN
jgi:hypothetical protein